MNINNSNDNIITEPNLIPNGFNSPNFIEIQPPIDSNLLVNIPPPNISNNSNLLKIVNNKEECDCECPNKLNNQEFINSNLNTSPSETNLTLNIETPSISPDESHLETPSISPDESHLETPSISPTETKEITETTEILNDIASTTVNKIERNKEKLKKEYDNLPTEEKKIYIIRNEIMQILPISLLIVLLIFILLLIYILTF